MPPYRDPEDPTWKDDADHEEEMEEDEEELEEEEAYELGDLPPELIELIEQTEELADSGDHLLAVKLWRKKIDRFSDEPQSYFFYGLSCFQLLSEQISQEDMWQSNADLIGIHEEALSMLEEAVSMEPELVDAWNLIGALHALRENYAEAIEAWERSLTIEPDQDEVQDDLAAARESLRDNS